MGVDIFFVISGFLISNIIFAALEKSKFSFLHFYARRIKRIFPALMLVLLACLIAGRFVLLADEYKKLGRQIAAGTAFIANFLFWSQAGYFDQVAEVKPLLHLWSLGVEEQYYLIWPVLLFTAWKLRWRMYFPLGVLFVLSFGIGIYEMHRDPVAAFYLPFDRMWELVLGAGLSYVTLRSKDSAAALSFVRKLEGDGSALLGLVLIGTAIAVLNKQSRFPGWWALLPACGAMLLIAAGPEARLNRYILSNRLAVFIGLISYPLYLWHWPLLSFARILHAGAPGAPEVVFLVSLSFPLAWLTYILLERPVRSTQTVRAPVILLAISALLGCAGEYVVHVNGITGGDPRYVHNEEQFLWEERGDNSDPACLTKFHLDGYSDNKCEIYDIKREPTAALLGDSHANSMYLGFARYFSARGENLVNLGRGGCLPFWDVQTEVRFGRSKPLECEAFTNRILDAVLASRTIHTVLFADYTELYKDSGSHQVISTVDTALKPGSETYVREFVKTIGKFQAAGKRVILVMDYPNLEIDPRPCIGRPLKWLSPNPQCSVPQTVIDARMEEPRKLKRRVLDNFPNLSYVDVSRAFCDGADCWAMRDGVLLYRDVDHLSHDGSLYFAPYIQVSNGPVPIDSPDEKSVPGRNLGPARVHRQGL